MRERALFLMVVMTVGGPAQARPVESSQAYTVADQAGVRLAGYSWRDSALLVAIGESAVRAMLDGRQVSLTGEPTYRQSMATLPGNAQNIFYADVQRLTRSIRNEAGEYDGPSQRGSLLWYLERLHALSSASSPVDDDGYQNTVIYLHMPNP